MMKSDLDYKTGEPTPVYGLYSNNNIESVSLDALVDGISSALY